MTDSNKPGILFWIVGFVALLWNAMGCLNYLAQAFDLEMATEGLSVEQIAFMEALPAWKYSFIRYCCFCRISSSYHPSIAKEIIC